MVSAPQRGSPSIEELQRQGREAWLAMRNRSLQPDSGDQSQPAAGSPAMRQIEQEQARGREAWLRMREEASKQTPEASPPREQEQHRGLEHQGPELDP